MKNICVYGAASNQVAEEYKRKVKELGKSLAEHGYGMVYGGGSCGLMGAAAYGVLENHGNVTGVVPGFMYEFEEINHLGDTKFVKTMSERKDMMEDLSDAFVIVPGGIGTMDEFFQVLTQRYLKRHFKPIILYNINGFYDSLMKFMDEMVEQKCLKRETVNYIRIANTVDEVIAQLPE